MKLIKPIRMVDGSTYCITDFDMTCEAKETGGRHFKGYADAFFDASGDDVHPDDRGIYKATCWFDGDWGMERSMLTADAFTKGHLVDRVITTKVWEPV